MSMSRDLADRLAVVQRFEHREEAAVLLDAAGERIQVTRARVAAERPPLRLRRAGRAHGAIHVRRGRLRETAPAACRWPG